MSGPAGGAGGAPSSPEGPRAAGLLDPIPLLRPHPGAERLFARRAERFAELAPGHAAGDYLAFLATLAGTQAEAARALAGAGAAPLLPLDASLPPPPAWLRALDAILADLGRHPLPAAARSALDRLAALDAGARGRLAARLLGDRLAGADVAAAPIAGAALQVAFAAAAAAGPLPGPRAPRSGSGCPVCGAPPMVGVISGDERLRYVACSLCGSQWHHTRVQCTRCGSAERLAYLSVDGSDGAARAEACDGCHAYLKLLDVERAPRLEPAADDVASLALDLLVGERGYARLGVNRYLATGTEEPLA